MKPLRASMLADCLLQVLGSGKKRPQGKAAATSNYGSGNLESLLSGKKILVVDDNMVNRRVAAGALIKKFGADVVCVESGKSALDLLRLPHGFDAYLWIFKCPKWTDLKQLV